MEGGGPGEGAGGLEGGAEEGVAVIVSMNSDVETYGRGLTASW
jgi:hypothetical protein